MNIRSVLTISSMALALVVPATGHAAGFRPVTTPVPSTSAFPYTDTAFDDSGTTTTTVASAVSMFAYRTPPSGAPIASEPIPTPASSLTTAIEHLADGTPVALRTVSGQMRVFTRSNAGWTDTGSIGSATSQPTIRRETDGRLVAAWTNGTFVHYAVHGTLTGDTWVVGTVNAAGGLTKASATATVRADGSAVVCWFSADSSGGFTTLYAGACSGRSALGVWDAAPYALPSSSVGDFGGQLLALDQQVSQSASGKIVVAYAANVGALGAPVYGTYYSVVRDAGAASFTPSGELSQNVAMTGSSSTLHQDGAGDVVFTYLHSGSVTTLRTRTSPAGGAFGDAVVSANLGDAAANTNLTVARLSSGALLAAWTAPGSTAVTAAVRPSGAGSVYGAPMPVADVEAGVYRFRLDASANRSGEAAVSWVDQAGANFHVHSAVYDATAPALELPASFPTTAVGNSPVALSATASDKFDAAPSVRWVIDGAAVAGGASFAHVFSSIGTHTVTVTAVDASGNESAPVTRTITNTIPANAFKVGKLGVAFVKGKLVVTTGTVAQCTFTTQPCKVAGTLSIKLPKVGKKPAKWLVIGKYAATVAGGKAAPIKITLTKAGVAYVKRKSQKAKFVATLATGGATKAATRTLTLKYPKPVKKNTK